MTLKHSRENASTPFMHYFKFKPVEAGEREKEHNFVRRFPGYARPSFW
jgi:hypothetical protein